MTDYSKIPPQAKELEAAVLGAMLIDAEAYDHVSAIIGPEAFYLDAHKEVFLAIQRLKSNGQPSDILMVKNELQRAGKLEQVGGGYFVTTLTNAVDNPARASSHARIILQKFIGRELIRVCGDIIQEAYEDMSDSLDLLDRAQQNFSRIDEHLSFGDMVPISKAIVETIIQIEKWRQNDSPITGTKTGFNQLDKATRGWQPGDLIIIAARPSKGKTAFALNIVMNAAQAYLEEFHAARDKAIKENSTPPVKAKAVAVWSLEMKYIMLVLRMLAATSGQILHRIQTGRLSDTEMKDMFKNGVQKLSRLGVFFDEKPGLTMQKLRSKARKLKKSENLGLIVVDYLQLMTSENKKGNREQEVSNISRELKLLALELDVPIIALSQMSREVEKRTGANAQPQLSDLRESGSIEQDADVVIFLYGPSDAEIEADVSLLNRRYAKIAKQRNGMLLKLDLDFKSEIQLFGEIEDVIKKSEVLGLPSGGWRPVADPDLFTEGKKKQEDPF